MEYKDIKNIINKNNYINAGKEVEVYKVNDNVIKIFHKDRKSGLEFISEDGLKKLTKLKLNCFNNPKELIYDNDKIVGYTEDYIEDNYLNIELLRNNLDLLYEDILTLSNNGFIINDLQYNYLSNNNTFKFIDMTSYKYINVDNIKSEVGKNFMLDKILKDNINTVNIVLIGLLDLGAYRKNSEYELTKTNKAVMFNRENCKDIYYGEYLKKQNSKTRR